MTSGAALVGAAELLGTRLDAELLLAHVLDAPRSAVIARDERVLTPEEQGDFEQLLARRVAGEPLAYLTGVKEFWSLELEVTPAVLVPRPETELLVEWALSLSPPHAPSFPRKRESSSELSSPRTRESRILDIGTGSGAIALALGSELRSATITATDISPAALRIARGNAQRLRIGNVEFREGDLFKALEPRLRGSDKTFDLIVSNPPYIGAADPHLAALTFEPKSALTDGADGLSILQRIVADAPAHLSPGGWLLVEHGMEQSAAVRALFTQAGFEAVETRRDLAGLERATGGRRP